MSFDLNEFSRKNRERCESPEGFNHKLTDWSLSDWMTAVMGELGEAANVAKKLNRVRDGIPGNKETEEELRAKLGRELADTACYLNLMFQRIGLDMGEEMAKVFNAKSEEIGSPIKFRSARSLKSMFLLSDDQMEKLKKWEEEQDAMVAEKYPRKGWSGAYYGATGGAYSYTWTPNTLGSCLVVRNGVTKEEIDLTDSENW